jgi:diacylglycerol kinase family enzyme
LKHNSYTTSGPKDAGRIGQEIASGNMSQEEPIRVIVAGGDGTAHELIEGIVSLPGHSGSNRTWQLIILPLGTVSQDT